MCVCAQTHAHTSAWLVLPAFCYLIGQNCGSFSVLSYDADDDGSMIESILINKTGM